MNKIDDLTIFLRAVDRTSGAFRSVTRSLESVRRISKFAAASVAAIGGATAAVIGTFKIFQGGIDDLAKTSDKLGITTERLEAIRLASNEAGISVSEVDNSLQRMIRRIGDSAATGTGAAANALARLNLDAAELTRLAPDEQLDRILRGLEQVEDVNERLSIAQGIFGREGVNLVRLLADNIDDAQMRMEEFNLTTSRFDAAKVEEANDNLDFMFKVLGKIRERIAIGLSSSISVLVDWFLAAAKQTDVLKISGNDMADSIARGIANVLNVIEPLIGAYILLSSAIQTVNRIALEGQQAILNGYLAIADIIPGGDSSATTNVRSELADINDEIEKSQAAFADLNDRWSQLNDGIRLGDKFLTDFGNKVESIAERVDVPTDGATPASSDGGIADVANFVAPLGELTLRPETVELDLTGFGVGEDVDIDVFGGIGEDNALLMESVSITNMQTESTLRSTEAFDAWGRSMSAANSILSTLGNSFAKTQSQARAFVAVQEVIAVVSAYSAATQALASLDAVTPFQKFAAYASVLARGLAGVAAIRSAGSRIGAGSSTSDSATSGAQAPTGPIGGTLQQQPERNRNVNITIEGLPDDDEVIIGLTARRLIESAVEQALIQAS